MRFLEMLDKKNNVQKIALNFIKMCLWSIKKLAENKVRLKCTNKTQISTLCTCIYIINTAFTYFNVSDPISTQRNLNRVLKELSVAPLVYFAESCVTTKHTQKMFSEIDIFSKPKKGQQFQVVFRVLLILSLNPMFYDYIASWQI